MGIITVITNKGDFNAKQPRRLRPPTSYTKVDELVKRKGVPITSYDYPSQRGLDTIKFNPYDNIMSFFKYRISSDNFGMQQGYSVPQQSRGQTGMVLCRMLLKDIIHHGPIQLCCPSSTLILTMKHASVPLFFV